MVLGFYVQLHLKKFNQSLVFDPIHLQWINWVAMKSLKQNNVFLKKILVLNCQALRAKITINTSHLKSLLSWQIFSIIWKTKFWSKSKLDNTTKLIINWMLCDWFDLLIKEIYHLCITNFLNFYYKKSFSINMCKHYL